MLDVSLLKYLDFHLLDPNIRRRNFLQILSQLNLQRLRLQVFHEFFPEPLVRQFA